MNIVKMSVATVLALVHLMLAIPLSFLLLFIVFGLPIKYLLNKVSSESKAYKVYEIIISSKNRKFWSLSKKE
jgi:hypothetical protein